MNGKFGEVFRFELAYQLQRPWTWLFFVVLVVLNFLMTRDATLSEALYEEFFVNSPFAIAKTTVFGNLIWLVMAGVVAGDAAARDVYTRMHPLLYTTSVTKAQYLGGKFLAAFVLNAMLLIAVQAGIMLAIYSPGVDPVLLGPFRFASYLTAYGFIALPTAFAATAIQFAISSTTGRPMASYGGSVLLVFMGFFIASLLLFNRGLGTLLDPIGIRFIVEDTAHLWTTVEKNYRLLQPEGVLLKNRVLWISIGAVFLLIGYLRFQFRHTVSTNFNPDSYLDQFINFRFSKREIGSIASDYETTIDQTILSTIIPTFGFRTEIVRTLSLSWSSFKALALSWTGLALLFFIPLLTFPVVVDQMQTNSGELVPTTIRVIRELTAPLSAELSRWVIIPAFIIFFAGELIWRERDARLAEISDAIAGSEWAPLIGKFIGLSLMLVAFTAMQMAAGILAQLAMGYSNFEIGLYIKILFALQLPEYLLFAMLALVVHVVVNQKYIGHMVAILVYVFIALSSLFGVEHNMLVYGAGPLWSYTDMRGFGNSIAPWLWFKFYWAAWALLLAVSAKLLFFRGVQQSWGQRIVLARYRFTRTTKITTGLAVILISAIGGFIFYNTNVLHEYLTEDEMKSRQADYEVRFGKYKGDAQPSIKSAKLQIEIYPRREEVVVKGDYYLANLSNTSIDSIHVATVPEVGTTQLIFKDGTKRILHDEKAGHSIFLVERALSPGDSIQLHFELCVKSKGFRESGADEAILSNGTYFMNSWFPAIGYKASRELITASDRRDYGLSPRPLIASLYDAKPQPRGHGIQFEAVVATDADQIACAPGALLKSWKENNRNYFHYKTDSPIGREWSFFSARYNVREEKWVSSDSLKRDVTIRILHVPEHTSHLDRMVESIRASLDYYSANFGHYPYNHLTVAEGPGEGRGIHADASMLTYAEGFSLWNPDNDELKFDFPFAIVAHEIAHQWTVPYANVEGAPVMSESVAWYYAMKLVEKAKGTEHLQKLLQDMRQPHPYPPIRRGEPLLRGLDPYLSYRRGPFALYTLSEYVGEDKVNQALRNLLEHHRAENAPLATTLDLYRQLQAVTPDSLSYLLHDLFEVNTYWELKVKQATAVKAKAGIWQLTVEIDAQKVVADSAGVERTVTMDEWLELGVFTEGNKSFQPTYLRKHRIRSGRQTISFTISQLPLRVGIDPNHLMIDLDLNDNFREVKEAGIRHFEDPRFER
jgi:ABC-2 type transport system permease protein